MRVFTLLCMFSISLCFSQQAISCSGSTACEVDEGEYFAVRPDTDKPVPAIVFIHGFGGSAKGALGRRSMVNTFLEKGYAVIAPNGTRRENGGGRRWAFHPWFPSSRDEIAFIQSVRDHAITQFNLDSERILLGGFSIGGSMTAYLACAAPKSFSAYAPLGGNFWRPHPVECEGPVRMLHTHGWRDGTVPLEGRVLRGDDSRDPNALIQGDIFHAMSIWRETNGCYQLKADSFVTEPDYWHRRWERCKPGSALELALYPGGHAMPKGWAPLVVTWYEGLPEK